MVLYKKIIPGLLAGLLIGLTFNIMLIDALTAVGIFVMLSVVLFMPYFVINFIKGGENEKQG